MYLAQSSTDQLLCAQPQKPIVTYNYNNKWSITSYSELKHNNDIDPYINFQHLLDFNLNNNFQEKKSTFTTLTTHTFPKGKRYGNFFHNLFKTLDFKKPINTQWLQTQMILHNINLEWITTIQRWIYTVINTPLNKYNLTLSQITVENKKTEFNFFLNINTTLKAEELNYLCKYYDYLSRISPILTFETITGMLQGFIDLIFYWNKKYYLLDYKTNWLGHNNTAYNQSHIESEMIKYRYDLQYQIYTLALHRFLKYRMKSYNYEKNFGGIYYIFIRGMNGISLNQGIYFCRPIWDFIKKLDNLF